MTISGAYGRDYKSKAAIAADLAADKDFVVRDTFGGGGAYTNASDLRAAGHTTVTVRYGADRKVTVCKVPPVAAPSPAGWEKAET